MGLLEVTIIIVAIVIILAIVVGIAIWIVRSKNAETRALEQCQQQVDANPQICVDIATSTNAYPGPLSIPSSYNPCFNSGAGTWGAPTDFFYQPGQTQKICQWQACNSSADNIAKTKTNITPHDMCVILSVNANSGCHPSDNDYVTNCPHALNQGDPCFPPTQPTFIQSCKPGLYCNDVTKVCTKADTQTCVDLAVKHEIYPGFKGAPNAPNPDNQMGPADLDTWTNFCQVPTQVTETLNTLTVDQECKILSSMARFGYTSVNPGFYVSRCAGQGEQGDYCIPPGSASDIQYCGAGLVCDTSSDGGKCEPFDCKTNAVDYYAYPSIYTNAGLPGIYVPTGTRSDITNNLTVCASTVASSTAAFGGANQMTNDEICYSLRANWNSGRGSLNDPFYQNHCKIPAPQGKPCIPGDAGGYTLCDAGLTCKIDATGTYNNAYSCQP